MDFTCRIALDYNFIMRKIIYFFLFLIPALIFSIDLAEFKTVLELNTYLENNWNKDDVNEREKLYALAVEGMKKNPDNAEIIGRVAWLELLLKKNDSGLAKITKAYAMAPQHWAIPIWAHFIYYNCGLNEPDLESSITLLQKAAGLKPESEAEINYLIGEKYLWAQQQNFEKALDYFNAAESMGYKNAQLFRERAEVCRQLKKHKEAEKDLQTALAIDDHDAHTYYTLAKLMYDEARFAEWAANAEQALSLKKPDFNSALEITIHDWLAFDYINKLGSLTNAKKHLSYLIKNFPDHQEFAQWKEDLAWLSEKKITVYGEYKIDKSGITTAANSIAIMLPVQNSFQKHLSYTFDPPPNRRTIYTRYGNMYASLEYTKAPAVIKARVELLFIPGSYTETGFSYDDSKDDPNQHKGYYVDSKIVVDPTDKDLKKLASEIVKDEKDTIKRAKLLHDWIFKNFTYQITFPSSIKEYLATRKAECGGYALVFTVLCRALDIPARRVFSPIFEYPTSRSLGSHETSEFYVKGHGWIPVNNTNNSFGWTSRVLSLWRNEPANAEQPAVYPVGIKATYLTGTGEIRELNFE